MIRGFLDIQCFYIRFELEFEGFCGCWFLKRVYIYISLFSSDSFVTRRRRTSRIAYCDYAYVIVL